MKIVEDTKPPGHAEWLERVQKIISSEPGYSRFRGEDGSLIHEEVYKEPRETWDGAYTKQDARKEGSNNQTEAEAKVAYIRADIERVDKEKKEGKLPAVKDLEVEPALTADQYVFQAIHAECL